jgi:hypothetical protein
MIDRPIQKIVSPFGERIRNGKKEQHDGIDLRCYNFLNWKKQAVIFPCDCEVLRIGFQTEWGWNVVARPIYPGEITELKFIHLCDPRQIIKENQSYNAKSQIGWTGVTEYMKKTKCGEHLHFGTFKNYDAIDPLKFYDEIGVQYE